MPGLSFLGEQLYRVSEEEGEMPVTLQQLQEAAARLVDSMVPVIVLQHGLKKPVRGDDGSWVVVADPDEVAEAVGQAAKHGLPNIGAVLAPKYGSRLVVVDIDGVAGRNKARELEVSSRGSVWVSRTGRGNLHVFYHWEGDDAPPRRVVKARKLSLDLLSNGYAVAPPSNIHLEPKGGGPYHWAKGHSPKDIPLSELDPLPRPLLAWWQETVARSPSPDGCSVPGMLHPEKTLGAWGLLGEVIPEGRRNRTLVRIAGWLRLYHPEPAVEALLLAVNQGRCQPPLDVKEVRNIVRSVFKYSQPGVNGHPRAAVPAYTRREDAHG